LNWFDLFLGLLFNGCRLLFLCSSSCKCRIFRESFLIELEIAEDLVHLSLDLIFALNHIKLILGGLYLLSLDLLLNLSDLRHLLLVIAQFFI
jgi:hypothetical protein